MSVRKNKQKILKILESEDFQDIQKHLDLLPVKGVINALFSAICRGEDLVHWHGVRCMGIYVARLAEKDMEEARIVMRRMLWSLNDESGGIGWGIPEAMAEIMRCHQGLADEYIHMLISYMREDGEELFQDGNYLEHEALQRGLLWGIGRLAEEKIEMLMKRGVIDDLLPYLDSPDAAVRGHAVRNLGLLHAGEAVDRIRFLVQDDEQFTLFRDDRLQKVSVGRLAEEAMDCLRQQREYV